METLTLEQKSVKPHFSTPKSAEKEVMTFAKLQRYEQLIAEGKMKSEPRVVRPLTAEEQVEFDRKITIDDIFANIEKKYGVKI